MKLTDYIYLKFDKPLYEKDGKCFIRLWDKYIKQSLATGKKMYIEIPSRGVGIYSASRWLKNAEYTKQVFKRPDQPMNLIGNYVKIVMFKSQCKSCGKRIYVYPSRSGTGKGKYCSTTCFAKGNSLEIPKERLIELYKTKGLSSQTIAKMFGCDVSSIYNYLSLYGIEKTYSSETRKMMSERYKGQRHSIRTEFKKGQISLFGGKKRPELSGEKHWNWQGGKTSTRKLVMVSQEYKRWRNSIFKRDHYTCVFCGNKSSKGNKVYLEADHIKPVSSYPELIFDETNGRTLCRKCHNKITNEQRKRNLLGQYATYDGYLENMARLASIWREKYERQPQVSVV